MKTLTTLDLPTFARNAIGFDSLFNELERGFANQSHGYPPYNIVQETDDEYVISLAVAGFNMDDIDIVHDKDMLRITGEMPKVDDDNVNYLHKGIAGRNFRREFKLADHVEVVSANLQLGMLNIFLKRVVPEELQPKRIEITQTVPSLGTK